MEEEIKRIAKAIIDSKKVTVLTGAGISTESGILISEVENRLVE